MKKRKTRTYQKNRSRATHRVETLPIGMQQTREVPSGEAKWRRRHNTFTPMETGHGPVDQEGGGNRQNDEMEELEKIEPQTKSGELGFDKT